MQTAGVAAEVLEALDIAAVIVDETGRMVDETMVNERVAGDLYRHISVNVARSKAFALSSEPQVGDALLPEINQTTVLVDQLLRKLGSMLTTPEEQAIFRNMLEANTEFLKGSLELSKFGEIVVDAKGHTSMPGVFAAGDCTTVPYKQIIIAAGEGAKAALSAFDHLIRN